MEKTNNKGFQKKLTILLIVFLSVFVIAGLSYALFITKAYKDYKNNNKTYLEEKGALIGGDKDEGGCLVAAGYSWCEIKQKCLRIWKEPCIEDFSKTLIENYIKENISKLSPEKEVLGGKFYITRFLFTNDNQVVVNYEDGHNAFQANVIFTIENNKVTIEKFSIPPEDDSSFDNNKMLETELTRLIAEKYNKKPEDITVKIENQTDFFANGIVEFISEDQLGNAGRFLAAQIDSKWQIAFDGNGLPKCSETDQYHFPADMLSSCINQNGELRKNDWELIKNAILNCQVKEIMQTHSQYVSAILTDGNKLEGIEPAIDDIIDLAVASQEKCGEILMATE